MSDNSSSNFIDRFEELGLSKNEAAVYLELLRNHPVTGYHLAKNSGILRPIVYEILPRLVKKGAVKLVKGSKTVKGAPAEQYSPIPPENFLAILEKRFDDARNYLSDELPKFSYSDQDRDEFWSINGKDTIISNVQDMIKNAKSDVLFYINNAEYALYLKEIISKKVASGIKVMGFSYRDINLPSTDLYSYNIDYGITHPSIEDDRLMVVVDNKNSIIADMDAGKACQSMRPSQISTAVEFIKMKISLYRLSSVLTPAKLSLYLFDEDKSFFETINKYGENHEN